MVVPGLRDVPTISPGYSTGASTLPSVLWPDESKTPVAEKTSASEHAEDWQVLVPTRSRAFGTVDRGRDRRLARPDRDRRQLWLDHLGNTSAVYGFRVLSEDETVTYAEGRRVQVRLDPGTLRPTAIGPELRAACRPLQREVLTQGLDARS